MLSDRGDTKKQTWDLDHKWKTKDDGNGVNGVYKNKEIEQDKDSTAIPENEVPNVSYFSLVSDHRVHTDSVYT
ncbi:hypothetical protein EVAR_47960_1 [Eumeta japonica]|uniref:Uncharacterized protein n=1 Tax=Eumeta variegata TaxID=151549 RepID=A0A4C1X6K3_EUMVA|nr:hypothetical protein EVAR_47960_1 [Eumeta japonica]